MGCCTVYRHSVPIYGTLCLIHHLKSRNIIMLQSVRNALYIFETVAKCEPVGVSELARRCKITKSTVQRCLKALNESGWIKVEENSRSTRWVITSKASSLGQKATEHGRLRETALPVMGNLWSKIEESVTLSIAEGDKAVLLERYESTSSAYMNAPRGSWAPMHIVCSGKVMLAYADRKTVDHYIAKGLEAMTDKTITDSKTLLKELNAIRRNGWGVSIDELLYGYSSAAAPIFGWNGVLVAVLGIALPTERFPENIHKTYISLLVDAAKEISRRLKE